MYMKIMVIHDETFTFPLLLRQSSITNLVEPIVCG